MSDMDESDLVTDFDIDELAEDLVPVAETAPPPEAQRRTDQRFRVRWKTGFVIGEGAKRKIFVMRTNDISLGGMSVLAPEKVPPQENYKILIVMPALQMSSKEVILELEGKVMYAVLDTAQGCFRLGVKFNQFKNDGRELLKKRLEKHHTPTS